MINMNNQKQNNRSMNGGRRLLAWLCALMMLISSGVTAFAETGQDIYSDPVSVPEDAEKASEPAEEAPEGVPDDDTGENTEKIPDESPEENPEETAEAQKDAGEQGKETADELIPDIMYSAGSLSAETGSCTVRIDYSSDACIPEDAVLTVRETEGMETFAALKSAEKVIRNEKTEENEIWVRKIADEGNRFYAVSLFDAEGNEIKPNAGVTLTCQNHESPEGVTYFLTGQEARILPEENGALIISDYNMAPFGYATVAQVQTGTITQEFSGRDYLVTATYGPEAGFPADTELKVREIMPGTDEYALYSGMTDEALNEAWSEITLERYFDITFISKGKEIEPRADIDVQITFNEVIELTEDHDVQAVHIENNEASVIEAATDSNEKAVHNDEAIDTVSFTSDSFSVYGVVQRKKIITKVLDADGKTYELTVTYRQEADIPENASLQVTEIEEGSDLWEAYRKQTAAALSADDVRLPGLYDITILDEKGEKVTPRVPVSVSVKLLNAEEGEPLHVVHFTEAIPDELVAAAAEEKAAPEEQTEARNDGSPEGIEPQQMKEAPLAEEDMIASQTITDAVVEGDTVTFETDGFSVYAFAYTVDFHFGVNGEQFDYSITGGGVIGLRELMKALNILDGDESRILEFVEEIEEVTFSDESLVKVVPVTEDITAAELKEKWELVCSYSAELTEEEIAEMDAKELYAPDWAFVSLQAFNTDEKLTVTLKDGEVLSIDVTDAQLVKTIITSGGETYRITVTYTQLAELPEGSALEVSEILPETGEETDEASEYSRYEDKIRDTLGWENGSASYLRLFDIRIVDENGQKLEIASPVEVSVELMDRDDTMEKPEVLHFAEGAVTGDVLTGVTVEGDTVSFEAESFSAYAIVEAPDPVPLGWNRVESVEELFSHEEGLYIGHPNGFYLKNGLTTTTDKGKTRTGITKTKPAQSSPPSSAAKYYFERVEGSDYQVYVYTYADDNETKQYVRNENNNSLTFTDDGHKTAFTITYNSEGFFTLNNGSWYWNMQGGDSGERFCAYNVNGDINNKLHFWYIGETPTDVYELDGKTWGLMYWNEDVAGKAMMAEALGDSALKALPLTVMTKKENHKDSLFVANNSNITQWTFEWKEDTFRYYIKTAIDYTEMYLKVTGEGITLTDNQEEATPLEFQPGTEIHQGQFYLNAGGYILTHSGSTDTGFTVKNSVTDEAWLRFVQPSNLTDEYFMTHSAQKVGISDAQISNGSRVILYTRNWNEEEKKYEFYAVDHDGTLVRCFESGDSIEWVGGALNSMLWNFIEYYDSDGSPTGYYDMFNEYSEKYLAPQIDGQTVSDHVIGLNMTGRQSGKYYSSILAWDEANYCFSGFKVEEDEIKTCIKQEALDFYFAIVEDLNINDTLTPVATVDHTQYGITMKVVNFDNTTVKGEGCTSSRQQHNVIGSSVYTQWVATQGLLSTNLQDDNYPTATKTNTSLGTLFAGATTVNKLFLQGTYNATGYYEFNSMDNYAYLSGNEFTVYKEIGTHDSSDKPTLKHGQFFPYNNLSAGKLASVNRKYTHQMNAAELNEENPRKYERLYLIDNPDYYFGVELEATFMQTPSGKDAWGHDIIFEFTGDDDFWLYVDGELVIDLGGIHSALPGKVNFCTGEVTVNGNKTTLRDLFTENYKARNTKCTDEELAEFLSQYFEDGSTIFRDYSEHTMRIFYMERGAGASNLHMRFNLAAVQKNHVKLSKELDGAETTETVMTEFPYQILYKMQDDSEPLLLMNEDSNANNSVDYVFYEGTTTPVKYLNSLIITDKCYEHVFMLKPGETADISFPEGAVSYSIVECGLNTDIYKHVYVNDEEINGTSVGNTNRSDYQYSPEFVTIDGHSRVRYKNTVENALRTLEISKILFDETGENQITGDKTKFNFRLYLGTEYDAEFTEANMQPYCVKDPEGYYCKRDKATGTFVRLPGNKNSFEDLTPEELKIAVFNTSIYGTITDIPVGYVIEIRDLLVGTRYRVEERPWEVPDGYTFKEYKNESETANNQASRTLVRNDKNVEVPGSEDMIAGNGPAHVDVCNLKGFGLRVNKVWTDEAFMKERDPIYFAVFVRDTDEDDSEALKLVPGSVRILPYTEKTIYWYYEKLPVSEKTNMDDYLIREVRIDTLPESLLVDDSGIVSGYTDKEIFSLKEADVLTLNGKQKGEENTAQFTYVVHYQQGEVPEGSNVRVDEVTNSRPGIIIRKEDWAGHALGGAEFRIDVQGADEDRVTIGTYISDDQKDGLVVEAFLSENVRYYLTETAAPQGYMGLHEELVFSEDQDHKVTVTADSNDEKYYELENTGTNSVILTIKDRPYQLKVVKTDRDTGAKLQGVTFALYRKKTVNGTTDFDTKPMAGYKDLITDEDGIIPKLDNTLPAGSYHLDETQTIDNYQKNPASVFFSVSKTGVITLDDVHQLYQSDATLTSSELEDGTGVYTITVPNVQLKKIRIQKIGDDKNKPNNGLDGAKFSFKASTPIDGFNDYDGLVSMNKQNKVGFLPSGNEEDDTIFILPVLPVKENGEREYYRLTETTVPENYLGMNGSVRLYVTTEETNGGFSFDCESKLDEGLVELVKEQGDDIYTLKVTNNRKGALSITKTVTVDGEAWTDTENGSPVDGIYTFTVSKAPDSSAAESTSDSSEEADPSESDKVIRYVQIKVTNGAAESYRVSYTDLAWDEISWETGGTAIVGDLREGDYIIAEIEPTNGSTLVSAKRGDEENSTTKTVTVHVTKGDTTAKNIKAQAFFTNNKSYVYIVKRWYNAYGEYEDSVTQTVNVELYKVGGEKVGEATIRPGELYPFEIEDTEAKYYVVETDNFTGYVKRYTIGQPDASTDENNVNDRYLGYGNASDIQAADGDTLCIMNTATKTGMQVVMHKKWIEFLDKGGQFYLGQLDGNNTATERYEMKLQVQLYYDAVPVDGGDNLVTKGTVTDELTVWHTQNHPFNTQILDNRMKNSDTEDDYVTTSAKLRLNYIGDWHWGFYENYGSGQAGGAGNLPEYGYYNGHLVHYVYYFDELKVFDGSDDWNNPTDVTDYWWKLWQNPVSENNNDGYTRTNIENRPKRLPVAKEWYKEDGTKITDEEMATYEDLMSLKSITVKLYISFDKKETWHEGASLILYKDHWSDCFEDLESITKNLGNQLGATKEQIEAAEYKLEEIWDEEYIRWEMHYQDYEAKIKNKVLPKGSIKIQKQWPEGDSGASAVLLKLGRASNNSIDNESVLTDIYDHPEDHSPEGKVYSVYEDDEHNKYIMIEKDGDEWPTIEITNLLMKHSVEDTTDGADNQTFDCYYYVEEVGYIANNTMYPIPTTGEKAWIVQYEGNSDYASHKVVSAKETNPDTLVVKNTVPKGEISVTKAWYQADGITPHNSTEGDTIKFKVFYKVEGDDITEYPYTAGADGNGNYSVVYNGSEWSTVSLSNLPTVASVTVGTETKVKSVTGYYVVEQTEGKALDVTYKLNSESAQSESPVAMVGTITIINKDTTGKVQVSKAFSGVENLPGTFKITATWTASGSEHSIDLELSDAEEVTKEGLDIKRTGDGKTTPYIWTIDGLPVGTVVTFKEIGFDGVAGYIWSGTVNGEMPEGGEMEGTATVSGEETLPDTAKVAFTNTYTAGVELPATGGPGTTIYTVAGLMLITLAGVLLVMRRRRYNR